MSAPTGALVRCPDNGALDASRRPVPPGSSRGAGTVPGFPPATKSSCPGGADIVW